MDILEFGFIQNAILAALLSGVSCGIIGSYMVSRRLLFLGGGITHSSLGGIGLAYWLGFSTTFGALLFAILSAFGIDRISRGGGVLRRFNISEDSAVSLIWSGGMALGVVFIFLTPGYAPNLMTYLFGNLLLTTSEQLLWLFVFDIFLVLLFTFFGKSILYCAMDCEYSRSQGMSTVLVNTVMLIVLSIGVVLNIMSLGVMLLLSMLTLPVLLAKLFSGSYWRIMILSCLFAIVGGLLGLWLSYLYDLPTSAISVVVFVGLLFVGYFCRFIFCSLRRS